MHAVGIEENTIVERDGTYLLENAYHLLLIVVTDCEKIEVFGRTQAILEPFGEQHSE